MSTQHRLMETSQIVQSAQVWVCDTCGGQDHKSCGCNSTARMEELAAKREAHRQAARAHREKAKENQQPRDNHASIENIEQSGNDIDPETSAAERRAYYVGADEAGYTAPAFIRNAPDPAAEAFQIIRHMSCQQWQRLIYLMDKHELLPVKGSEEGDSIIEAGRRQVEAAPPDDGLDIPDHLRRGAS